MDAELAGLKFESYRNTMLVKINGANVTDNLWCKNNLLFLIWRQSQRQRAQRTRRKAGNREKLQTNIKSSRPACPLWWWAFVL